MFCDIREADIDMTITSDVTAFSSVGLGKEPSSTIMFNLQDTHRSAVDISIIANGSDHSKSCVTDHFMEMLDLFSRDLGT